MRPATGPSHCWRVFGTRRSLFTDRVDDPPDREQTEANEIAGAGRNTSSWVPINVPSSAAARIGTRRRTSPRRSR